MRDSRAHLGESGISSIKYRLLTSLLAKEGIELPRKILKRDISGPIPLSFAQQRLWFIDQLTPNTPFYNIPGAVKLDGKVDLEALERSVNEIVRRHEVLRTRIEVEEGQPVQVVDEWKPKRFTVEDLTSLAREEREEEASRIAREEAAMGFDLSKGPLLRVRVLRLDEEAHVLLFTMHHIVSDGWSMEILNREVRALYQAYCAGEPSPLEELEIQYADFAVWQREWLKGEVLERELEYWRKQLQEMEDLELPADHPRPAARSYRGANQQFVIGKEITERLRALGGREGVTLFMTMLGSFGVLMSRYSGQKDIVFGTDIANRNRAEIEGLIGFFVNQLVVRVKMSPSQTFRDFLKQVGKVCMEAYAHQDLPFEKLVEELQPERDLSRAPFFQAKLVLEKAAGVEPEPQESRMRALGVEMGIAKLDLMLRIMDVGHSLLGVLGYSRDLFEDETIERLMNHFTNILRDIIEDSDRPISELNLLSNQEREQIVVEWNGTQMPYPDDRCIHELFQQQAERTPEQMALIYQGQGVSYRELNRRANQLAHYLQSLGVGPEVVVGLCLERSIEIVVGLMGVLKAGGAYLPLDPESPLERLGYMLEDAGAGVTLTEQKFEARLPAFWGQTVCLDSEWKRISEENEGEPGSEVEAENLAYVIYTSGSTGKPKGVMVRHRSLVNYTQAL